MELKYSEDDNGVISFLISDELLNQKIETLHRVNHADMDSLAKEGDYKIISYCDLFHHLCTQGRVAELSMALAQDIFKTTNS